MCTYIHTKCTHKRYLFRYFYTCMDGHWMVAWVPTNYYAGLYAIFLFFREKVYVIISLTITAYYLACLLSGVDRVSVVARTQALNLMSVRNGECQWKKYTMVPHNNATAIILIYVYFFFEKSFPFYCRARTHYNLTVTIVIINITRHHHSPRHAHSDRMEKRCKRNIVTNWFFFSAKNIKLLGFFSFSWKGQSELLYLFIIPWLFTIHLRRKNIFSVVHPLAFIYISSS